MSEKFLMKGNEAIACAAIRCGCKHFFGYPITPQTELAAYMARELPKIGGVFLQAESEIAAINMVLGAASAGVRVMTSSSSPGISLKTEGISYIAGSDVPAVIVDVQRGGPGLGGIQPSQADYWQATKATGHGDFQLIVIAPSTVQEMVDLTTLAFDLADQYRMPTMIFADGLLGQMMEPVTLEENYKPKVFDKPWALDGHKGKRKHNVVTSMYLQPIDLERTIDERFKKYDLIKEKEQRFEEYLTDDADIVVVAYGASARVARSAINVARKNKGIKVGLLRPITLWPFPNKIIKKLSGTTKKFLCVEMSKGQMVDDVRLAVNGKRNVEFFGRTGGIVPTPKEVYEKIISMNGGLE